MYRLVFLFFLTLQACSNNDSKSAVNPTQDSFVVSQAAKTDDVNLQRLINSKNLFYLKKDPRHLSKTFNSVELIDSKIIAFVYGAKYPSEQRLYIEVPYGNEKFKIEIQSSKSERLLSKVYSYVRRDEVFPGEVNLRVEYKSTVMSSAASILKIYELNFDDRGHVSSLAIDILTAEFNYYQKAPYELAIRLNSDVPTVLPLQISNPGHGQGHNFVKAQDCSGEETLTNSNQGKYYLNHYLDYDVRGNFNRESVEIKFATNYGEFFKQDSMIHIQNLQNHELQIGENIVQAGVSPSFGACRGVEIKKVYLTKVKRNEDRKITEIAGTLYLEFFYHDGVGRVDKTVLTHFNFE